MSDKRRAILGIGIFLLVVGSAAVWIWLTGLMASHGGHL